MIVVVVVLWMFEHSKTKPADTPYYVLPAPDVTPVSGSYPFALPSEHVTPAEPGWWRSGGNVTSTYSSYRNVVATRKRHRRILSQTVTTIVNRKKVNSVTSPVPCVCVYVMISTDIVYCENYYRILYYL